MVIFVEFSASKNSGVSADSAEAKELVAKLQAHITANYYACTDEIPAGLGKTYVADERFKKNIDKYSDRIAAFVSQSLYSVEKSDIAKELMNDSIFLTWNSRQHIYA